MQARLIPGLRPPCCISRIARIAVIAICLASCPRNRTPEPCLRAWTMERSAGRSAASPAPKRTRSGASETTADSGRVRFASSFPEGHGKWILHGYIPAGVDSRFRSSDCHGLYARCGDRSNGLEPVRRYSRRLLNEPIYKSFVLWRSKGARTSSPPAQWSARYRYRDTWSAH